MASWKIPIFMLGFWGGVSFEWFWRVVLKMETLTCLVESCWLIPNIFRMTLNFAASLFLEQSWTHPRILKSSYKIHPIKIILSIKAFSTPTPKLWLCPLWQWFFVAKKWNLSLLPNQNSCSYGRTSRPLSSSCRYGSTMLMLQVSRPGNQCWWNRWRSSLRWPLMLRMRRRPHVLPWF